MKIKNISLKYLLLANFFAVILVGLALSPNVKDLFFVPVLAQTSSDALAVRIIPNPHHFSAQRWYQLQGFSGSPQSLIVDGYKAVRDGRTVYVSATNVVDNKLYTNIYLISYDQRSDQKTIDIFGKILNTWKFNSNISLEQQVGQCLISSKSCKTDDDCPEEGYSCGNGDTGVLSFQSHKCVIKESDIDDIKNTKNTPSCILDSDCPQNLFCSGLKAKIVRDLDRLEKIVLLKEKIQAYYNINQKYPVLGAGTYSPHIAVSTWPSWQSTFLSQVGTNDISDPVNKLGSCYDIDGKFDLDTCWNPVDHIFVDSSVNYDNFILPASSYAMAYVTNANGSDYKMCATMETALGGQNYILADGGLMSSDSCSLASLGTNYNIGSTGFTTNTAPYITEKNLSGLSGTEFVAYVKAIDNENHPISWSIITSSLSNHWGSSLSIIDTNNPNQKIIKSSYAGNPGLSTFTLRLTDILGSSTDEVMTINIASSSPQIVVGDISHNLSYNNSFFQEININFANKIGGTGTKKVNFCLLNSSNDCVDVGVDVGLNETEDIGNNFKVGLRAETNNNWKAQLSYASATVKGDFNYKISATDSYGETTEKTFNIKITANKPVINFNNCSKVTEMGDFYSCPLNTNDQNEAPFFSLISPISLPAGLTLASTSSGNFSIQGTTTSLLNNLKIEVEAINKYDLTATSSFNLNVVSGCGSYLIQHPGGPWNSSGTIRNHNGYYKTVLIGDQCWLQDNLNVGTMIIGSTSASSTNNIYEPLDASTIEKYCLENSSINCDIYGALYTKAEATSNTAINTAIITTGYNRRGICPPGFRIALEDDWTVLEKYLSGSSTCRTLYDWQCSDAGKKIKYSGLNSFSALLGGYAKKLTLNSPFTFATSTVSGYKLTRFMSVIQANGNGVAAYREINSNEENINIQSVGSSVDGAFYIRCVKGADSEASWTSEYTLIDPPSTDGNGTGDNNGNNGGFGDSENPENPEDPEDQGVDTKSTNPNK